MLQCVASCCSVCCSVLQCVLQSSAGIAVLPDAAHVCSITIVFLNGVSFADAEGSLADTKGSFADMKGSFPDIEGYRGLMLHKR